MYILKINSTDDNNEDIYNKNESIIKEYIDKFNYNVENIIENYKNEKTINFKKKEIDEFNLALDKINKQYYKTYINRNKYLINKDISDILKKNKEVKDIMDEIKHKKVEMRKNKNINVYDSKYKGKGTIIEYDKDKDIFNYNAKNKENIKLRTESLSYFLCNKFKYKKNLFIENNVEVLHIFEIEDNNENKIIGALNIFKDYININ